MLCLLMKKRGHEKLSDKSMDRIARHRATLVLDYNFKDKDA